MARSSRAEAKDRNSDPAKIWVNPTRVLTDGTVDDVQVDPVRLHEVQNAMLKVRHEDALATLIIPADTAPALHQPDSCPVVFYDDPRVSHLDPSPFPDGFMFAFDQLIARSAAQSAVEVGCAEGFLTRRVAGCGCDVTGVDKSAAAIHTAREIAERKGAAVRYAAVELSALPRTLSADLLVCVDLLQHLDDAEAALKRIAGFRCRFALFAVPDGRRQRLHHLVRGQHLATYGRAPEQTHYWSPRAFTDLVAQHFAPVSVRRASGWTLVLARFPRRSLLPRARGSSVVELQNVNATEDSHDRRPSRARH